MKFKVAVYVRASGEEKEKEKEKQLFGEVLRSKPTFVEFGIASRFCPYLPQIRFLIRVARQYRRSFTAASSLRVCQSAITVAALYVDERLDPPSASQPSTLFG